MESCIIWRETLHVQVSVVFIDISLHFDCLLTEWQLDTLQGAEFKIQWLSCRLTFTRPIPLAGLQMAALAAKIVARKFPKQVSLLAG